MYVMGCYTPQYGVYYNNFPVCFDDDLKECEEFYNKQIEEWKETYANKPIDKNDNLSIVNIHEDYIIKQTSMMDLI